MKLTTIIFLGLILSMQAGFAQKAEVEPPICDSPPENPSQPSWDYKACIVFKKLADHYNGLPSIEVLGRADQRATLKVSANQKVQCVMLAEYTADYQGCLKALKLYDAVLIAENAMNIQQQIRVEANAQSTQKEMANKAAQGDLQVGGLEASEKTQKFNASLYQESSYAFAAAALALGAQGIPAVPEENKVKKKICGEKLSNKHGVTVSPNECEGVIGQKRGSIFGNSGAKGILISEVARYTSMAAVAEIKRKESLHNAGQAEAAKDYLLDQTPEEKLLHKCILNPTDPECAVNRNRNPIDSVADGGGVQFGGDGSYNSFDMNGSGEFFEEGNETTYDGKEIASVNSPFKDEAKAAQGILDPAAAANVQPGGGAVNGGGGGGGVGGGGGGGGMAAADESSSEESLDPVMKSRSGDGNYEKGSGSGYAATSKGKGDKDTNPFASLFDSKGSGGIEEDRSIASGDISGQSSGLFQKISKRYGQVHADKRVEANNLE